MKKHVRGLPTKHRAELERRALLATRALVDRVRTLYRELEQLTGAPIAVHRALTCIGAEAGISASQLAVDLGMRRPAVSHVLNNLDERGWIERVRSVADQRSVRIFATAAGKQVLKATSGRAVVLLQRAVGRLANEELAALGVALEKLISFLPNAPPRVATQMRRKRRAP